MMKIKRGYMLYKIENYKMTVEEFVTLHNEAQKWSMEFYLPA